MSAITISGGAIWLTLGRYMVLFAGESV